MRTTILSGEGDEFRRADEIAEFELMLRESETVQRQRADMSPIGRLILRSAVFGIPEGNSTYTDPDPRTMIKHYPFASN